MSEYNVVNYTEQGGAKTVIGGEIDITGVLKLAGAAVNATAAQLNALAGSVTGLAALVAAGAGASASYSKTTDGAKTLLAANANGEGARTVLIIVTVDEVFAAGTGGATNFDIGETDTANKFKNDLATGAAGSVLVYAGTLTEEKALIVTGTPATGTGTGGISVTVLAFPAAS